MKFGTWETLFREAVRLVQGLPQEGRTALRFWGRRRGNLPRKKSNETTEAAIGLLRVCDQTERPWKWSEVAEAAKALREFKEALAVSMKISEE